MGFYERMMAMAVQIKRIANKTHAQTAFTHELENIQYKSPEELRSLQAVSLSELLNHAVENIPFYRKYKDKFEFSPETVFDDIRQLPIIKKEDIVDNREMFIADNVAVINELKTAGTLGNKATMAMDRQQYLKQPDEFFNKSVGMVPGKSRLILKADDQSDEANKIGGFDYEINKLTQVYRVDHRHMNNKKIGFIIDIIRNRKPRIIWGNTHGAYVIASYIEKNNIDIPPVELFICGGQTMLPQYSKVIERVFKSKVYDRYGSVECGNTANQCRVQDGYHYVPIVHYIEILDDEMKPVGENEIGNLYITTLTKRAMPVIRYDTGDLAVHTSRTCRCGCNFPIIKKIMGRRKEGIISPSGTYLSLSPLNLIINQEDKIRDFQMIQTAPDTLVINYTGNGEVINKDSQEKIKSDINSSLDYKMNISFLEVKELEALNNGKMLRIIPLDRKGELNGAI